MSVIITGGTGFVGAQVARSLLNEGEKDICAFHLNPSTKLIADIVGEITVVRGDLGNFSHVLNLVKTCRPKTIYHIGGMLSIPSDADHAAAFRANALGSFHVLEAARLFEVPQVIFTSSIATYAYDLKEGQVIDDYSLQRPEVFYGVTKLFAEAMGRFYARKHGLDYRCIRYPSVVGPGVKTPGFLQYTSWMIEESIKGKPFTVNVSPDTKAPIVYYKDAAHSLLQLARAPRENIKMFNYLIAGVKPTASAQELAAIVKAKIPGAKINFQPDPKVQEIINKVVHPIDDHVAQAEWGWQAQYDLAGIVDDFISEMGKNPQRYA